MRRSRLSALTGVVAVIGASLLGASTATAAPAAASADSTTGFIVLAEKGASAQALADRLSAAGGTVRSVNTAIGMVSVSTTSGAFADQARAMAGVAGVAADRSIGTTGVTRAKGPDPVEKEHVFQKSRANGSADLPAPPEGHDPLDGLLWGAEMVNAFEAHMTSGVTGDKVRVGILDTGVDGKHIDLRDNFNADLSRNFTTDMPDIDGPCEEADCTDAADVDDDGHGTHVAGTIAASLNGVGLSGIAPTAEIVNIRGGQDSGYFFLAPVVDALTYAGDSGLDVVNMSFYVDPWLYNCLGGAPEDSEAAAAEQGTIIEAMTRALDYANSKGVTLVGALGNNHEDLAKPRTDYSSPDYPDGAAYPRTIDNKTCFDLPVEGPHVIGVSALGPSERKADYSNYTTDPTSGEIEVSAPGGWYRDGLGTDSYRTNGNLILSTAPLHVLQATGEVDKNGNITKAGRDAGVMKACTNGKHQQRTAECGYYQWLQGTSMAAPHASGVAALAVAAHGSGSSAATFGLVPATTRSILMGTARDHACPEGGVMDYTNVGRNAEFTATCVGTPEFNGFYGAGIVDAMGVVQ
ncbi:MAG: S8 family serine peptidase [Actinobacteria bacterium]|nr:S8 family serine peptidase [Actinomycetota bacterium]